MIALLALILKQLNYLKYESQLLLKTIIMKLLAIVLHLIENLPIFQKFKNIKIVKD